MLSGVFDTREYVDAGGLMSYGPNIDAIYHQLAHYATKFLKRTSVGNVPVEQPTEFEMVINRRTANAIGIRLPLDLLASADQVIEKNSHQHAATHQCPVLKRLHRS
jgi:putative ABC transport system substrate-binding protein